MNTPTAADDRKDVDKKVEAVTTARTPMAMNDPMNFDLDLERLSDDSMDLDWDLGRPLAEDPDNKAVKIDNPMDLPFAAIAGQYY